MVSTGAMKWEYLTEGPTDNVVSPPTVSSGGTVYVISNPSNTSVLYAIDGETGLRNGSIRLGMMKVHTIHVRPLVNME